MAIFKCKMCGGTLEINNGESIATCEYCGAKQTLPTAKDENIQGLFNRANILRMKCEFDKAEQLYEKIVQADQTQSEAYWGLILCKYGIEYVEDPKTFKRVPTCHRTSFETIVSDNDYKSAIENADIYQRGIYEEEAKEIDRLQKEILELSKKESPYDVFICYKETDDSGTRTQDSVIANDIYYQLTQEGLKVFYAAITLEDKLGSSYEPCIFAALNSAKVMLSIGTKPEYFNAVWVKNEWSRFLKLMKNDRSKMLIPCYRDMDAYELPEEFAHLQAQDMSKIGFINDIVRGIKKVVSNNTSEPPVNPNAYTGFSAVDNITPLIKRMYLFLEDREIERADEFCEQILNLNPESAEAYIGKLLIDFKCTCKEDLSKQSSVISNNKNYQKVIRFGNEEEKRFVEEANKAILERIEARKRIEEQENELKRQKLESEKPVYDIKPVLDYPIHYGAWKNEISSLETPEVYERFCAENDWQIEYRQRCYVELLKRDAVWRPDESITTQISNNDYTKSYMYFGLCRHCGGYFEGLFKKKCDKCGKGKDY